MTGRAVRLAVAAATVVTLAACTDGAPAVGKGDLVAVGDLTGQTYRIGAHTGATQTLLCQIALAALQSGGAGVMDACAGDEDVRAALTSHDIDVYWEDTGTAARPLLVDPSRPAPVVPTDTSVSAARSRDAANGIDWSTPAKIEVTSGLAIAAEEGRRRNVQTVTDVARLVSAGVPVVWCLTRDFVARSDGWPAVQRTYPPPADPGQVRELDTDEIPDLVRDGACTVGEVDPLTASSPGHDGLTVLTDDRGAIGRYPTAPVVRRDIPEHDRVERLLGYVAEQLDDRTLAGLSARIAGGQAPADVARDWVRGLPVPRPPD